MPTTSIVRSIPPQPHLHYAISLAATNVRITVFGIWMSDGNQLPPAGRNRLPHLLRQTIDPARWGRRFRLPAEADFSHSYLIRQHGTPPRGVHNRFSGFG